MYNDATLDPKYLGKISSDFVKVSETLKEASYTIRKRVFSACPVFVMCQTDQPVGQLLVDTGQFENKWKYFASFLEELKQRGLVADEKLFKENYKEPDEFCCLFVIDKQFIKTDFYPLSCRLVHL